MPIGDGLVLDLDDREIIADGGTNANTFRKYVAQESLIASPIELAIVTHADSDHWKGMETLLGLKQGPRPFAVEEFWEPGYDRDCGKLPTYDAFIQSMGTLVPSAGMHRPLEATLVPATASLAPSPINLNRIPGVPITGLHRRTCPRGRTAHT